MGTLGCETEGTVQPATDKHVQFGIFSPEQIRSMSVTTEGIKYPYPFHKYSRKPRLGGVMDPRQGPVGSSFCLTCKGKKNCPGHFGHIDLAVPVFHARFITKCMKILRCVCVYCSKLLVSPEDPTVKKIMENTKGDPRKRFSRIYKLCMKKKICERDEEMDDGEIRRMPHGGCGRFQPSIRRQQHQLRGQWNAVNDAPKYAFTAMDVLRIFSAIPDETCTFLGLDPKFARPEWMVITVFPVPPPSLRHTVISYKRKRQYDLTLKLQDIVKANNELSINKASGKSNIKIADGIKKLQRHVALYMESEPPSLPEANLKNGRPSAESRFRGKEGHTQNNLMGKRVDFPSRTVNSRKRKFSQDFFMADDNRSKIIRMDRGEVNLSGLGVRLLRKAGRFLFQQGLFRLANSVFNQAICYFNYALGRD